MLSVYWLFSWGFAALILRAAAGVPWTRLLWGMAGCVPVLLAAGIIARRYIPGAGNIMALLDARNCCGGILAASSETDMSAWQGMMPVLSIPRARWDWRRTALYLAAGFLFVAGSLCMPYIHKDIITPRRLQVDNLVHRLDANIEILEEEQVLDTERAKELREQLRNIWEESTALDPEKSWEALDSIDKTITEESRKAAEAVLSETGKLSDMQALTDTLADMADKQIDPAAMTEAMKEFAALMKERGLDKLLAENGNIELSEAIANMSLTPEQMKELARTLSECISKREGTLSRLCAAKMVDSEKLKQLKEAARTGDEALAQFLESQGQMAMLSMMHVLQKGKPGISRGRGDAPITFSDGTKEDGAAFKEKTITPAALSDIKKSMLVGMGTTAPEERVQPVGDSGALSGAAAGGGSAHKHVILPRHSRAVKNYFQRENK
jgi:hypothetical protein